MWVKLPPKQGFPGQQFLPGPQGESCHYNPVPVETRASGTSHTHSHSPGECRKKKFLQHYINEGHAYTSSEKSLMKAYEPHTAAAKSTSELRAENEYGTNIRHLETH